MIDVTPSIHRVPSGDSLFCYVDYGLLMGSIVKDQMGETIIDSSNNRNVTLTIYVFKAVTLDLLRYKMSLI